MTLEPEAAPDPAARATVVAALRRLAADIERHAGAVAMGAAQPPAPASSERQDNQAAPEARQPQQ